MNDERLRWRVEAVVVLRTDARPDAELMRESIRATFGEDFMRMLQTPSTERGGR